MTTTGAPAGLLAEIERLRTLLTTAARMLRNAAEVYRHLRMDTAADQELHQRQIDLLDRGAAALDLQSLPSSFVAASDSPPGAVGLGLVPPGPNPTETGAE